MTKRVCQGPSLPPSIARPLRHKRQLSWAPTPSREWSSVSRQPLRISPVPLKLAFNNAATTDSIRHNHPRFPSTQLRRKLRFEGLLPVTVPSNGQCVADVPSPLPKRECNKRIMTRHGGGRGRAAVVLQHSDSCFVARLNLSPPRPATVTFGAASYASSALR